jgi:hypothetical protein
MLRELLAREISPAEISEFEEISSVKNRFVYTAGICVNESLFFHETIVIGSQQSDESDVLSLNKETLPFDDPETRVGITKEGSMAEKAIEMFETVDAKMIRQCLDMMNLRRSSNVRLALTRIFRSTGDSEELMQSIQNEAGKIVSADDLGDLHMVQAINHDGFLKPVVELLCAEVFGKGGQG